MWPMHVYDIFVNSSGYHRGSVGFLIGIYIFLDLYLKEGSMFRYLKLILVKNDNNCVYWVSCTSSHVDGCV